MTILVKLTYAAIVAALIVILVAFGVRALYTSPKEPVYPAPPFGRAPVVVATPTGGGIATPTVVSPTPAEMAQYEEEQRRFQEDYDRYRDDRRDYRRNVFLISAFIAIAAVVTGASLWSRLDAMSLGFIAGGFATLLYGVVQADGDLDNISATLIFVVALAGLVAVLAAGYRWLSERES